MRYSYCTYEHWPIFILIQIFAATDELLRLITNSKFYFFFHNRRSESLRMRTPKSLLLSISTYCGSKPEYFSLNPQTPLPTLNIYSLALSYPHRRRIKTEAKAKVITSIWGTEFIQFLAALAILHQDDLKKETIHPILQNRPSAKQLQRRKRN